MIAWRTADVERLQEFEEKITIAWLNTEYPQFSVSDQNNAVSISKASNVIKAVLENYSILDPALKIEWNIEPEPLDSALVQSSLNSGIFFIDQGALVPDGSYEVSCVI